MHAALALTLCWFAQDAEPAPFTPPTFEDPAFEDVELPSLDAATFDAWRSYLLPTDAEAAFEQIPWRPTFADGLRAAAGADRPLLLWVMNGHPLGCT